MDNHKFSDLNKLIERAKDCGWNTALFGYYKDCFLSNECLNEDLRSTDFRFLLPVNPSFKVLVIGCGWGAVPSCLADIFGQIFVVDTIMEKIEFLNIRIRQQNTRNVYPIFIRGIEFLPFNSQAFDIIVFNGFPWEFSSQPTFKKILKITSSYLKQGGSVYFRLTNKLDFRRILMRRKYSNIPSNHSYVGYKRIFKAEGYSQVEFYALLPFSDGIPLFYVPLNKTGPFKYFINNLFPLFEAVSPEVKRRYAMEYGMVKLAVKLASKLGLIPVGKFFLPGFCVVAKNGTSSS